MGLKTTAQIQDAKLAERERLISEMEVELGFAEDHPDDEQYLTTSPADLVQNMRSGKEGWTVERVMTAYIRSACTAHRKTNCLSEVLFRQALDEAKSKDKERIVSGEAEGQFWGLPSSFKDTFHVLGVDTSLGSSPYCFQPTENPEDEAGLVKLFRSAGGIPFCKTNVPQMLLAFECSNPVFGATSNPHSATRTSGGSSGGEAALVTMRGTPLAWGSDIGGSLRIPAHYSGCCGLKPVRGRWPMTGGRSGVPGFEGISVSVGPMARNVTDLAFASRSMLTLASELKPGTSGEVLMPIPWRDIELPRKLKAGYFVECGGVKTSPACARAVCDTVAALKDAGHEVVPFELPDSIESLRVLAALTSADGYKTLLSNIGKDPMEPSMQLVTAGSKLPSILHSLAVWVVRNILGDEIFASVFSVSRSKSTKEYMHWTKRRMEFASRFHKAAWYENNLDMIICPVQAVPAMEHGATQFLSPLALATIIFNVADSTVGVLPVTHVDRDLDALPPDFLAGSPNSWLLEKRVYGESNPAYNAETMHGLPVGVQVVGRPWEEEKVLAMMKAVEDLVQYS